MSVVSEVKQRTDIIEVIGQYTKLTKSGRMFRGLCPFHTEKAPSFFVYPEQQSWHCFGACNTGGDVFSFIMKKENMTFGEALHFLAQRAGVIIPERFEGGEKKEAKEALYQISEAATLYFHHLLLNSGEGAPARKYAASRGFTDATIQNFQLGFSLNGWEGLKNHLLEKEYPETKMVEAGLIITSEDGKTHDRFRNRLMFPIFDARGHVTGFGARALDDSLPKYLNSPQSEVFDKSATLYGLNFAARSIREHDLAVIVEGYIDVITAHQHGFTNVVASMGTSITETQVRSLKRLSRNLTLALDADAAGEEAMLRGIQYENILDAEIRVLIIPEGKDPDDIISTDAASWQKLLEKATPIVDFTFNKIASRFDLKSARGKSQTTEELLPIIASIENPVRQAHYLQNLAHLVGVPERTMELALQRRKSPAPKRRRYEETTTAPAPTSHSLTAIPTEEHLLAFLLQHPEMKQNAQELSPEYFRNSENREIFLAWQQHEDPTSLKESLEPTLREYVSTLLGRQSLPSPAEPRYEYLVNELKLKFHLAREANITEILKTADAGADLAKLEEIGIENSVKIKESYQRKRGQGRSKEMRR
ncbi:DNA primase [Chloroflexota bacterium]